MVIKAIHRVNKISVAIKRVPCTFDDMNHMKYLLREITIMRQLSEKEGCTHIPQLYEILIPEKYINNIQKISSLFLVMEYVPLTLKDVLTGNAKDDN